MSKTLEAWRPAEAAMILRRGTTFDPTLTCTISDVAVDWSTHAATLTLTSGAETLTYTSGDGDITLHADGRIVPTISAADTAAIAWSSGAYRLTLTEPGGAVRLLLFGAVTVVDL